MNRAPIEGIIHGKTIELINDPGLQDGQRVEVVVHPLTSDANHLEGIRRAAGALSGHWTAADDAILEQIQQNRETASRRDVL